MRKSVCVVLMLAMAVPAFAVEGSDVAYVGGTASQLKSGVVGSFDMASATGLVFAYQGGTLEIPYDRIESYEHSKEVAIHLGVAPAIAVGLIKRRKRNHFLRITFRDSGNMHQVVVFEIPKTQPIVLMPVLMARSPQARCAPFIECAPMMPMASNRVKVQENSAAGSGGQVVSPAPSK
jgi:hypothetical protein